MANDENLIPNSARSPEELRENGRKGGVASGKARQKKRLMKDLVIEMLNSKIWSDELKAKILNVFPEMEDEKMQVQTAMIASQIQKAMKGDTKAFEVMRDTAGQKPVDKQEITNIDQDGYRRVLMGDEDIFAGDYGSADEGDEEEDKKE